MCIEIEEWRPDINLYKILSSWHNSSDGSAQQDENLHGLEITLDILSLKETYIFNNCIMNKSLKAFRPNKLTEEMV